jgi:hypothetical protein
MKNKIIITLFVIVCSQMSMAQVGIGTTSPNASAKLDITSTNKGFLPPRVTLTGTADVTTIANPATGLFIYNTATAGTSPSNVTPGLYYFDGSKWQRIINQQPDATIEFNQATPTTAGVVFTPNTPASKDYVYVSTIDNSQWTYNGSTYVTYTPPASTAWNLADGTNDAGSNKTGSIYRTGNVGIGTTTPSSPLTVGNATGTIRGEITLNPSSTQYEGGQILFKKSLIGSTRDWYIDQHGTTAADARLRILSTLSGVSGLNILENGNVGLGASVPYSKLHVQTSDAISLYVESNTADNNGMIVLNANTTQNWSSGFHEFLFFQKSGINIGAIFSSNGSSVTYGTTSDYRLKNDFKLFNGMELVNKIKTYDFAWKSNGSRMYGVIANELQEVLPYLVSGTKDALDANGKIIPQTVDYGQLTPILIKALQEQDIKLKEQQKQIDELIRRLK